MHELIAELRKLEAEATKGEWWYDSYNTVFSGTAKDKSIKEICAIPDHPEGDSYKPEQVTERGAWYSESANNVDLIITMRNNILSLLDELNARKNTIDELKEQLKGSFKYVDGGKRKPLQWSEEDEER